MQVNCIHLSRKSTRGTCKGNSKFLHYQSIFSAMRKERKELFTLKNINNFTTSFYSWLIAAASE